MSNIIYPAQTAESIGAAKLSGSNTFVGSQTVSGNINFANTSGFAYIQMSGSTNRSAITTANLTGTVYNSTAKLVLIGEESDNISLGSIISNTKMNGAAVVSGSFRVNSDSIFDNNVVITGSSAYSLSIKGGLLVTGSQLGDAGSKLYFFDTKSMVYRSGSDSNGTLVLSTNESDRVNITSTGLVGINKTSPNSQLDVNGNTIVTGTLKIVNNNIILNSGYGIDFSDTNNGITGSNGSLTSEVFSDYECGFFTPSLSSSAVSNFSSTSRSGSYVRIGKMVHGTLDITLSSTGGGSGDVYVTGFPFVTDNRSSPNMTGYLITTFMSNANIGSRVTPCGYFRNNSESRVQLWIPDSTGVNMSTVAVTNLTSTTQFKMSFSYETS